MLKRIKLGSVKTGTSVGTMTVLSTHINPPSPLGSLCSHCMIAANRFNRSYMMRNSRISRVWVRSDSKEREAQKTTLFRKSRNRLSSKEKGRDVNPENTCSKGNNRIDEITGVLLYNYFNFRQTTFSDLILFLMINLIFLGMGSALQGLLLSQNFGENLSPWESLYDLFVVILGQELPPKGSSTFPQQVFAVAIAFFGLASFALILALIEQVVLEILESQVTVGSKVYEQGHYCLIGWGESARDIGQCTRIVKEICASQRHRNGTTIAVLVANREKLEMESIFRQTVPEEQRYGSRLVFRQGSPLDPSSLDIVSFKTARSVIICGDYSRSIRDSDSQVLRCAVLMDEAISKIKGEKPYIVAEVQSRAGVELLQYACSPSVKPISTTLINTKRTVRLLRHPVVAVVSHQLFEHSSSAHMGVYDVPKSLKGKTISELIDHFPYSIPAGFMDIVSGESDLNPDPNRTIRATERLILLNSTYYGDDFCLENGIPGISKNDSWDPSEYLWNSIDHEPVYQAVPTTCISGRPVRMSSSWNEENEPVNPCFVVGDSKLKSPKNILVCGWPGAPYSRHLLMALDSEMDGLPEGSSITLVNNHPWDQIRRALKPEELKKITIEHIKCDPRDREDLSELVDVTKFSAAIVMQDTMWITGPRAMDIDTPSEAAYALSQTDMLRLDAAVLTVQLNIRYLLEKQGKSDINIIAEKLASEGDTRFEDRRRLPLGAAINSSSFAAKALAQEALLPGTMDIYATLGIKCGIYVQDSSAFVKVGEQISFNSLQKRCASVQQLLLGYYHVPDAAYMTEPIDLILNPQGEKMRTQLESWNQGDYRCKLITAAPIQLSTGVKDSQTTQSQERNTSFV